MTARDQYYLDKRAMTAPSHLPGNKRRPLHMTSAGQVSLSVSHSEAERHQATRSLAPSSSRNTERDDDIAQFHAKRAAVDLPKRHELLSHTDEFKTLTESIAEQMRQRPEQTCDPVDGAAVPRDSFLYLRRVDSNPYHLALTHHARIDPNDYYTVSRLGVTHFAYQSSEFLTMEAFERENYIYSLIIKVRARCVCGRATTVRRSVMSANNSRCVMLRLLTDWLAVTC